MLTTILTWITSWLLGEDFQKLTEPKSQDIPKGPIDPGQRPRLPIPVRPADEPVERDCSYYSYPTFIPTQWTQAPGNPNQNPVPYPPRVDSFVDMQNRLRQIEEQRKMDAREIHELRYTVMKMQTEIDEFHKSQIQYRKGPQPVPMGWASPHLKKDDPSTLTLVNPITNDINWEKANDTQNGKSHRNYLPEINNWEPKMKTRPEWNGRINGYPPFAQMQPPMGPITPSFAFDSTGQKRNMYRKLVYQPNNGLGTGDEKAKPKICLDYEKNGVEFLLFKVDVSIHHKISLAVRKPQFSTKKCH